MNTPVVFVIVAKFHFEFSANSSELINFCSPRIDQNTYGFIVISGRIEAN